MRRHVDYHRLRHFLCTDFLRLIALKAIWSTRPNWREINRKKVSFVIESRRVGRSLISVNKSIKETQNLNFFSVRSKFISLTNTKICIFTCGYCHSLKYCFWCSFGEIKIRSYTEKKSNILYMLLVCYRLWKSFKAATLAKWLEARTSNLTLGLSLLHLYGFEPQTDTYIAC